MNISLARRTQRQARRCSNCVDSRNSIHTIQFLGRAWSKMVVNKYWSHFQDISGEIKKRQQEELMKSRNGAHKRPLCCLDDWTQIRFHCVYPDALLALVSTSHVHSVFCKGTCAGSWNWHPAICSTLVATLIATLTLCFFQLHLACFGQLFKHFLLECFESNL